MEFKEFSEYNNPEEEDYDIKSSFRNNEEDPIEIPEDINNMYIPDLEEVIKYFFRHHPNDETLDVEKIRKEMKEEKNNKREEESKRRNIDDIIEDYFNEYNGDETLHMEEFENKRKSK